MRLPRARKRAAERLAKEDGGSLNQWIAAAVAQKVGVVEAAEFFKKRAGKAKGDGLMKFLRKAAGAETRFGCWGCGTRQNLRSEPCESSAPTGKTGPFFARNAKSKPSKIASARRVRRPPPFPWRQSLGLGARLASAHWRQ